MIEINFHDKIIMGIENAYFDTTYSTVKCIVHTRVLFIYDSLDKDQCNKLLCAWCGRHFWNHEQVSLKNVLELLSIEKSEIFILYVVSLIILPTFVEKKYVDIMCLSCTI